MALKLRNASDASASAKYATAAQTPQREPTLVARVNFESQAMPQYRAKADYTRQPNNNSDGYACAVRNAQNANDRYIDGSPGDSSSTTSPPISTSSRSMAADLCGCNERGVAQMNAKNAQLVATHRYPQSHAVTIQRLCAQASQTKESENVFRAHITTSPKDNEFLAADAETLQYEYAQSDELGDADIELEFPYGEGDEHVLLMNMAVRDVDIASADNNDMKGDAIQASRKNTVDETDAMRQIPREWLSGKDLLSFERREYLKDFEGIVAEMCECNAVLSDFKADDTGTTKQLKDKPRIRVNVAIMGGMGRSR